MNDKQRIDIIAHLLRSGEREAELYRMARSSLGLRVYSGEAFELFGQLLGVVGPRQEDPQQDLVECPARLH